MYSTLKKIDQTFHHNIHQNFSGQAAHLTCCSDIEATGFTDNHINGIYTFTGTLINGRHLYVEQNKVYGIWFNGKFGDAAEWVLGYMTNIAEGKLTFGVAFSSFHNKDSFCPSLTKVWKEYFNLQGTYSTKAIVKCLSGD